MGIEQPLVTTRIGRITLAVAPDVNLAWVYGVWERHVRARRTHIAIVESPYGDGRRRVVVKVYRRRKAHGILRRLLEDRATHEARGYEAFARRGLPTAPLLFWGRERRFGLFCAGLVATAHIEAEPIHAAYARQPDERLIDGAVDLLSAIHRAELCHGDPRLRNFLASRPVPTVIDLGSWSFMSPRSQVRDLTRLLGSAAALPGAPPDMRAMLERYARTGPSLPCAAGRVLALANRYHRERGAP
ncbi:MAG TPA: hypothetical protein DCM87_18410 [Planctomycetes bacterium]|nr:hypothetical protein [Planctomycetota bacterium]